MVTPVGDLGASKEDGQSPELRYDSLIGGWTILAPSRSRRPGGMRGGEGRRGPCPFCPGNEVLTPPEIWAEGRESGIPDSPGWNIRVIPNLYPALVEVPSPKKRSGQGRRVRPARGVHEVIIHSPHHHLSLGDMDPDSAVGLMRAYRSRYRELCARPGVRQVLIILNHGREAGASLEHPHTQVLALPLVPTGVREELRRWKKSASRGCPLCSAVEEARREGRVVLENEGWTALTPFASRLPYETWFVPRRHRPDFARTGEAELRSMADVLTRVLKGMSILLHDPPYNLWLHSAPCDGTAPREYHWHLEMMPRLTVTAGFEMASGLYLNPVPPEEAALRLRQVII